MVKIRGASVLALLAMSVASAADFGTSTEIKAAHPEFFAPNHVSIVTNGGVAYYIYNGRARRLFKNMPPAAMRLRDISQLRAENNLSRFLLKGQSKRQLVLSGSRQIVKDICDDWATYVFAVPVTNVKVAETLPPPIALETNATSEVKKDIVRQTNGIASTAAKTKPRDSGETMFGGMLDHVDQNPMDHETRAKLAKAMFDRQLYDEAVEQCIMVQNALIPIASVSMPKANIESLLSVSEILKECGEYRKARDGYKTVQRLEKNEYRGIVLKALSQIQLKLGVD